MPRLTWPNRLFALALLAGAPACGAIEGGDADTATLAPPEAWPDRITVSTSTVTMGTATGTLRWDVPVEGFSFSRFPTTNRQYQSCVSSGVCREPSLRTGNCETWPRPGEQPGMLEWPVGCVTPEESATYCSWVGAEGLPTDEQWTLASRGRTPTRFAWGDSVPTCKTHISGPPGGKDVGCPAQGDARVGLRPKGASPLGAEDVLVYRAELLRRNPASQWPGCKAERGCFVRGATNAAIDGYIGYPSVETELKDPYGVPMSTFRCVWE
jgi:hypothetical protein